MGQPQDNGHKELQSLIDRMGSQISDRTRAQNSRVDALVMQVTRSQSRQRRAAAVIWGLGILALVAAAATNWIRWHAAIVAALAWMIAWNYLSNRLIVSFGLFRIRRGTLKILRKV